MEKSSPRALTKKGKLTEHDRNSLKYIQLAEGATDHSAISKAEAMAIEFGAQETYKRLFKTFSYKGMHVLHYAARFGKIALTAHLVAYLGVDINKKCSRGRTALHYAIALNSPQYISYVIQNLHANFEGKDNVGLTPRHLSILTQRYKALEELLKRGADTNISFLYGKPIHAAAAKRDGLAVDALISKQVDVNDIVDVCINPLASAVYHGSVTSLKALLKAGADIHLSKLISKAIVADLPSTESIVKVLLDHNANPNEFDEVMYEDAPIIAAAKRKQIPVVELLISTDQHVQPY